MLELLLKCDGSFCCPTPHELFGVRDWGVRAVRVWTVERTGLTGCRLKGLEARISGPCQPLSTYTGVYSKTLPAHSGEKITISFNKRLKDIPPNSPRLGESRFALSPTAKRSWPETLIAVEPYETPDIAVSGPYMQAPFEGDIVCR